MKFPSKNLYAVYPIKYIFMQNCRESYVPHEWTSTDAPESIATLCPKCSGTTTPTPPPQVVGIGICTIKVRWLWDHLGPDSI